MAKCQLDIDNEKFRKDVGWGKDLSAGLEELRKKLARDHKLSQFVSQPMPGYKDLQNRIWKWDFAPAGSTSSTRPSWRLFAYVADPDGGEPVVATPFLAWAKADKPGGYSPSEIAEALRAFLNRHIVKLELREFHRWNVSDDLMISLCGQCGERTSLDPADADTLDLAESTHECQEGLAKL